MNYTQIADSYKYDTIASAIYGRELEYFHYEFDLINFQFMVKHLPEGEALADIQKRIKDTEAGMAQSQLLVQALESQIDDREAYDEAVIRTVKKRAKAEKRAEEK